MQPRHKPKPEKNRLNALRRLNISSATKKPGPAPGTGGRPKKEIDRDSFEKLCALHPTLLEVCEFFGVTDKTLNAWCVETYQTTFSEVFQSKRSVGKLSLRRKQFETAMRGDKTMQIWLGKQWLGQTEKTEISGDRQKPFVLAYKLDEGEKIEDTTKE